MSLSKPKSIFWCLFFIYRIWTISLWMIIDKVIMCLWAWTSTDWTRTGTFLGTSFSTSFVTSTILAHAIILSNSFKNSSIILIWYWSSGLFVLSFNNSAMSTPNLPFKLPYSSLYLAYWTCTSTSMATPRLFSSVISCTYFSTYTIWGIITIFSTIFYKMWGTSTSFSIVVFIGTTFSSFTYIASATLSTTFLMSVFMSNWTCGTIFSSFLSTSSMTVLVVWIGTTTYLQISTAFGSWTTIGTLKGILVYWGIMRGFSE